MEFYIFDANRLDFDNGNGGGGPLVDHLRYLARFGGTPDCRETIEAKDATEALIIAAEFNQPLYVVETTSANVVGLVNGHLREIA